MANSLTAYNYDIVGQKIIEKVSPKLAPLASFSLDCSPMPSDDGDTVNVPLVVAGTASAWAGSYSGYAEDLADTKVPVQLDTRQGSGWEISDSEMQDIDRGLWSISAERRVAKKAEALTKAMFQNVMALFTTANYGAQVFSDAAANFGPDNVVDLEQTADDADWDDERNLLLKPSYTANFKKDDNIQGNSAFAGDVRGRGPINFSGFDIHSTPHIPGNSEDLIGVACTPACAAVAIRPILPQGKVLHFEVLTDEMTGISFGYRVFYDEDAGKVVHTVEARWGKAVGDSAQAKLLDSSP